MKKDAVIKKVIKLHTDLLESSHKLRDFVYTVEDPDLCEQIDEWCENFEGYLEEDGSVDDIIESIERLYDVLEDEA